MILFSPSWRDRLPRWQYAALLLIIFVLLLASRRSMQFMLPQVWDEEGTQILRTFVEQGWSSLLLPVNGYLITVPRLIVMLSVSLSAMAYPMVSTLLSALFIGAVGVAIAMAPTKLNAKVLCALAVFFIPADPEVFALPLYTFWWASILLLLLVLWDENAPALGWRLLFLLLGGLSSPVIVLVFPALWFRAFLYRRQRAELILAVAATLTVAVQIYFMVAGSAGSMPPLGSTVRKIVPTFFGNFLIGNLLHRNGLLWVAGIAAAGLASAWLVRGRARPQTWLLMYLLVGSIGLSVARVDPALMHPKLAGPRYFFFPFILLFWVLIQYAFSLQRAWARRVLGGALMLVVANAMPVWSRSHDDLKWRDHLQSCRQFSNYVLPIHYDGHAASAWGLRMSGANCQALMGRALFDSHAPRERPQFAYAAYREAAALAGHAEFLSSSMSGADFAHSQMAGYRVLGSYGDRGDADTGELVLKMRRGSSILYRSGPATYGQSMQIVGHEREYSARLPAAAEWVTLEFSNQRLPEEFTLRISDTGQGWGEWSAVAVKTE